MAQLDLVRATPVDNSGPSRRLKVLELSNTE
jgi:hypothetical protein